MPPALRRTLVETARAMRIARDDWWIIGSAAVALHGATGLAVADVDMLVSENDARRLMSALAIAPLADAAHPLFRSTIFARWHAPPLAVEWMAGLHVATPYGWTAIEPRSRVAIPVDGAIAYIPDRAELTAMLHLFGRPKDLARARMLAG